MKAGTIVTAEFPGVVATKRRPALVVSTAIYHAERPDVILALVTSQFSKASAKIELYPSGLAACGTL